MDYAKEALALHKKYRGKIEIRSKVPLKTEKDLSAAYTPGVAAVCHKIRQNRDEAWNLTNKSNMVAIVSDGTAVLGLGNIGPRSALPVMEGKAAIFKEFAGVDAVPLCINTTRTDEIVKFCRDIEPSFGGINLEDISAPRCFEIAERLEKELSIPVFHDDQDGTAIVVLAALTNACRVTGKAMENLRVVINGAGAAGIAIAKLLLARGIKDIILIDSIGAIYAGRENLNLFKEKIAKKTNRRKISGRLEEALAGTDVFIGVSRANLMDERMVKSMNPRPIIFAMANPVPEIMPPAAINAGAAVVGTGRSDYPNQINNILVFPGIFRGMLDARIKKLTPEMKLSVAAALANAVGRPTKRKILSGALDRSAVRAVAGAVKAFGSGGK